MKSYYKLILLFIFSSSLSAISFKQSVSDQEMMKHGKEVYQNRCIGCHGEKGDGKGTAAKFLDPKPRDFTEGVFKFKTTPNEALPTDEDLMKILSQGVLGTSMPSFKLMPEVSKYAVVQYIKSFSDMWKQNENIMARIQGSTFPIEDFREHKKFITRAKIGKKLFLDNCVSCHGRKGLGDGEGGEDLTDDWDQLILPANLTKKHIKSGKSVRDIYNVLLTGMAGTPMPSFKDVLTDDELWDVTAYVLYLRGLKAGTYENIKTPIKEITKQEVEDL